MFLLEICNTLHLLPLNSICVNSLGLFGGANNGWSMQFRIIGEQGDV